MLYVLSDKEKQKKKLYKKKTNEQTSNNKTKKNRKKTIRGNVKDIINHKSIFSDYKTLYSIVQYTPGVFLLFIET